MKKYRVLGRLIALKGTGFFSSKKFLTIAVLLFISSMAIAGGIIFNAGLIQTQVSITDNPPQYYDVTIEGQPTPCTIVESLQMLPESTLTIEYNIKNNEAYPLQVNFDVLSIDAGLTVVILDGTLNPCTQLTLNAGENKYFNTKYTTDDTVSTGDTLNAEIQVQVETP